MVVFDTTILRLLLRPDADPPNDPNSGEQVTHCRNRIEYLIEQLEEDRETILIPTPVLAELLVKEENFGPTHLEFIDHHAVFKIVEFDRRAAIELAAMTREALAESAASENAESKTKVKFDRQIIAIGRVNQATTIFSDDKNLRKKARLVGLEARGVHVLPTKPEPPQAELDLPPHPSDD